MSKSFGTKIDVLLLNIYPILILSIIDLDDQGQSLQSIKVVYLFTKCLNYKWNIMYYLFGTMCANLWILSNSTFQCKK